MIPVLLRLGGAGPGPSGSLVFPAPLFLVSSKKKKKKSAVKLNIEVWTCVPAAAPDWTNHSRTPVIDW